MNKADPPRSFGVFKPAGHTVLIFPDGKSLDDAAQHLMQTNIVDGECTSYTPQEMLTQTEADLQGASALAAIGQEVNLVKMHRERAQQGCHFLVVPTSNDARARKVADLVQPMGALAAQHYGSFMVEDLIDPPGGTRQVFESPDRGLDTPQPSDPPRT